MSVMVLSPHGDDAELSMGATMAEWAASRDEDDSVVRHVLLSVPAVGGRTLREREFDQACAELGVSAVVGAYFVDNEFRRSLHSIVALIEDLLRLHKPKVLCVPLPWFNDDHKVVWEAALAALRPVEGLFQPRRVYAYEMPAQEWGARLPETGALYRAVSEVHLNQKIKALKCYRSQKASRTGGVIGPDGVQLIAKLRGLEIGVPLAERLWVVREVRA